MGRLREEGKRQNWFRDYENGREIQRQIVEVTEQLVGPANYRTMTERRALEELTQLCTLSNPDRVEFQEAIQLMNVSGDRLMREGDYASAIGKFQTANRVLVRLLKPDSGSIIACNQYLTVAYCLQNDWEKAKVQCIETVEMRRRMQGEAHPEYLNQRGILGGILEANNELDKAEPLLREVVRDFERFGARIIRASQRISIVSVRYFTRLRSSRRPKQRSRMR